MLFQLVLFEKHLFSSSHCELEVTRSLPGEKWMASWHPKQGAIGEGRAGECWDYTLILAHQK